MRLPKFNETPTLAEQGYQIRPEIVPFIGKVPVDLLSAHSLHDPLEPIPRQDLPTAEALLADPETRALCEVLKNIKVQYR
jgi:hypothetical protein